MPDTPPVTDRTRIVNDSSRPLTVVLAPWAREHVVAPDEAVVVEARGPAGPAAELYVDRTCEAAFVWGWAGAEMRLLAADGRVLADWVGNS